MGRRGQDPDHRRRFVAGVVCALVAVGAIAAGGGVAVARSDGEVQARATSKPRCLWAGRDCFPPANLWYRVAVEFDGQLTFRLQPGLRGVQACFPCWVRTTELEWRIAGHNAVRLRLMCDDEDDSAGPFQVKRRINGKRRTIGGCAPGARGDVHPSLRFASNGAGEVTRWMNTAVVDPVDGPVGRCEGYTHTTTASSQALSGAIRTTGGSVGGFQIDISPLGRVMPPTGPGPTYTCTNKTTGAVTTHRPAGSPAGVGACCHLWGSTGWYQRDMLGWRPISQKLRFSPRAANFGRRYAAILEATQEEITESPINPPPAPGAAFLQDEQSYHYKIVLEPCPNRGLDVERC